MIKNKKILYGLLAASLLTVAFVTLVLNPQPPKKSEEKTHWIPVEKPEATPEEVDLDNLSSFLIEEAKADLASLLGISEEKIELFSAERVDWPDTSIGLPQSGKVYAQVITPGFRLLLKTNDQIYQYHTDWHRVLFVGER